MVSDPPLLDQLETALFETTWLGEKQLAAMLAPYKLTVPQFYTLLFIAADGRGSTMSHLAGATRHSLATMTGIIDRLVAAGLVERGSDPDDRRKVLVMHTPEGRELVAKVHAARREQLTAAVGKLKARDQKELLRLVRAFSAALGVVGE